MRRTTLPVWCVAWSLLLPAAGWGGTAREAARYADPPMPPYRVEAGGFEGATAADIKAVCDSAGRELWRHFPGYEIGRFVVIRSHGGPITLHRRNERGEIVVGLDTGQTYWCQYAYQFAHEFCHILCGLSRGESPNRWFEETLCETASLYAIRAMARAWNEDPPFPHWRDFRDALRTYADDVIAGRARLRAIHRDGLAAFYRAHESELRREPCRRDLNGAMAVVLLRLFEQEPARWETVRWLDAVPPAADRPFDQYLRKWRDAVPDRHRAFVGRVADLFGVDLDGEAD